MIAVDTNVLVYAHREELPQHRAARAKLTALAEADRTWGIPVFCVAEFVRVVTHPKLFDPPYGADEACRAVDQLLASPSVRVLHSGPSFFAHFAEAVRDANAVGNLVFDAQIVAVCRESGVTSLLTEDRDFARFRRFKTERL